MFLFFLFINGWKRKIKIFFGGGGGGACTLWKYSVLSKGAHIGPARAK